MRARFGEGSKSEDGIPGLERIGALDGEELPGQPMTIPGAEVTSPISQHGSLRRLKPSRTRVACSRATAKRSPPEVSDSKRRPMSPADRELSSFSRPLAPSVAST